jgi:hypothetical protein
MSTYGGDSYTPEHLLQRQRRNEIIGSFIPEDEAIKMSNGRYVCIVCPARHVFDTIEMLAVHREGKKHREHYVKFKEDKRALREEKQKREVERMINAGLKNSKLNLQKAPEGTTPLLETTKKKTQNALLSSLHQPSFFAHNPYSTINMNTSTPSSSDSFFQPAFSTTTSTNNSTRQTPTNSSASSSTNFFAQQHQYHQQYLGFAPIPYQSVQNMSAGEIPYNSLAYKYDPNAAARKKKRRKTSSSQMDPAELEMTKYREKLTAAGWRWDANGNIFKDEAVEFDSDEEAPPPPPTKTSPSSPQNKTDSSSSNNNSNNVNITDDKGKEKGNDSMNDDNKNPEQKNDDNNITATKEDINGDDKNDNPTSRNASENNNVIDDKDKQNA